MKNVTSDHHYTPIQKYYAGKCIFLTGATGFFGKVILEKLLNSCPEVDTIYISLRKKDGKCIESRFNELLTSPIFSKLSSVQKNKIKYVEAELGLPDLGISQENRSMLIERVNIVFHLASTGMFDEKLGDALKVNVVGTSDIIFLCKSLKRLESFVYVSTVFSNNSQNDSRIDESIFKSNLSIETAKTFCLIDDPTLDSLTPRLIHDWPNVYTFTKCIAENVVKNESDGLPVAIYRPTIALGTSGSSTIPGFVDKICGINEFINEIQYGLLRVYNIDGEMPSNFIPIDYCVNGIIATAWDLSENKYQSTPIYNHLPDEKTNATWEVITALWIRSGYYFPVDNCLWWPNLLLVKSKIYYLFAFIFLQLIPGILIDFGLYISGQKPKLLKTHCKINAFGKKMEFTRKRWTFETKSLENLMKRMSAEDLNIFYMDMKGFDWSSYALSQMHGFRTYLLKMKPSDLPKCRKRVKQLKQIHYFTITILSFLLLWIVCVFAEKIYKCF